MFVAQLKDHEWRPDSLGETYWKKKAKFWPQSVLTFKRRSSLTQVKSPCYTMKELKSKSPRSFPFIKLLYFSLPILIKTWWTLRSRGIFRDWFTIALQCLAQYYTCMKYLLSKWMNKWMDELMNKSYIEYYAVLGKVLATKVTRWKRHSPKQGWDTLNMTFSKILGLQWQAGDDILIKAHKIAIWSSPVSEKASCFSKRLPLY